MPYGEEYGSEYGSTGLAEIDIAARMAKRIPTLLRSAQQVVLLNAFFGEFFARAEDTAQRHLHFKTVTQGFGATLDRHGVGLRLPRRGRDDATYKIALIVRFAALMRERTPELALELLTTLIGMSSTTALYREWYPAAYEYVLMDIDADVAALWEELLRTAKPEGVRMQTRVVEDLDEAFQYDVGPGYDAGVYAYTLESGG